MQLSLEPIDKLKNTSPITIKRFKNLGIETFQDLIEYFPYKYRDFSNIKPLSQVQFGDKITVIGKIVEKRQEVSKKGLTLQFVKIYDETDNLWLLWFNQRYILYTLKNGMTISVFGEIKPYFMQKTLFVEEYEILKNKKNIHTGRIVPFYPERKGLSSKVIREKIHFVLSLNPKFPEFLPEEIIKFNNLVSLQEAYENIHFPKSLKLAKKAKERLAFNELFLLQLSSRLIKKTWREKLNAPKIIMNTEIQNSLKKLINNLPFKLTNAQNKALYEIISDLTSGRPMNRFLQGDVGAGKTVVAALAAFLLYLNGYQTLFMAPTEILALQHYQTFLEIFENNPIKIGLQTRTKKIVKEGKIESYDIIIGTHALLNEKLSFENVGLVIVDEQQRFGVLQRLMLRQKGETPHFLTMTATPIPRTAALVLYGELDISVLNEMPKGRKPVKTYLIPPEKRPSAYNWIREKIENENYQVFVVCPLIEESEKETMKNVKAATVEYEKLKEIFKPINVGLLHGKMPAREKQDIIDELKKGKIKILVATPVIEVGIDVKTANIIVIETAERYGLSQLHQLRGRVGRGNIQGYCLIFSETKKRETLDRLRFFASTTNGFKLSEYDLKHRGPGEILGTKQHGFVNVKIASLLDYKLIELTNKAVEYFVLNKKLIDYPEIEKKVKKIQKKIINID